MKRIVVAHPGRQHSMHTAIGLDKEGMLLQYITTVYDKPHSLTHAVSLFLSGRDKKKAQTRSNGMLPNDKITQFCELRGLILLAIRRIPLIRRFAGNYNDTLMKSFGIKVAKYAIKNSADGVIMYDSTACDAFKYLKRHAPNIKRILDISISHRAYNKIVYENDFDYCGDPAVKTEQQYLWTDKLQRFLKETDFADYCLVPSQFVKKSVEYAGVADSKILLVPYGVNIEQFLKVERNRAVDAPLSLIFVGGVSRRKGCHHLLKVVSQYPKEQVCLNVVGSVSDKYDLYTTYKAYENISFSGFLTRENLCKAYENADVFILPSLCEGLALVGLEAMAVGLPLICSENTGVNDLITDEENGLIIKASDEESLKSAIDWCLIHRDGLSAIGNRAREKSKEYSWDIYYDNLCKYINKAME